MMTSPIEKKTQARTFGAALRRLRKLKEIPQQRAAEILNQSQQSWQRYETGASLALLDDDTRADILAAIGASEGDFRKALRDLADDTPPGVEAPSPPDAPEDLGDLIPLTVMGDDLAPWAEQGTVVYYDRMGIPRRSDGIVVKKSGGGYVVRRYVRTTPSHLITFKMEARTIDGLNAYIEVPDEIPRLEYEGVWPIRHRRG